MHAQLPSFNLSRYKQVAGCGLASLVTDQPRALSNLNLDSCNGAMCAFEEPQTRQVPLLSQTD